VAYSARLAEGAEGVRRIFRAIFLADTIRIQDLARMVALPIPVVAAVRGELEKRQLVKRKGGISLTKDGLSLVTTELGISCKWQVPEQGRPEMPVGLDGVLKQMTDISKERPSVDVRLDQSHATPETSLRRAIYLYENDALEGRDLLVIGDDDLTSVAMGLLAVHLRFRIRRLVVVELDKRLVNFLRMVARRKGIALEVIPHDLRHEIPRELKGQFDVFFTDPPYTLPGLALFVSRGIIGLRDEVGKQGFICFGRRTPRETAQAIGILVAMGLAPQEILPNFNQYVGSQVLGGVSQMIRAVTTGNAEPQISGSYQGGFYTADQKKTQRRGKHSSAKQHRKHKRGSY